MSRPITKEELSEQAEDDFRDLMSLLGPYPDEVLCSELYAWHRQFLKWIEGNLHGTHGHFPSEVDDVCQCGESSLVLLEQSHSDVMTLLCGFTDESLFDGNLYPWLDGKDLATYFLRVTSDNYRKAIDLLRE